jgi:hypothetical protein
MAELGEIDWDKRDRMVDEYDQLRKVFESKPDTMSLAYLHRLAALLQVPIMAIGDEQINRLLPQVRALASERGDFEAFCSALKPNAPLVWSKEVLQKREKQRQRFEAENKDLQEQFELAIRKQERAEEFQRHG